MTDEEKNVGTERWPSKENIVSFFFMWTRSARGCTLNKFSCRPWTSSSIVGFCATLSSSLDLISIDAGHGGRNDGEGNHACACEIDFSLCLVLF